jgi:serine phosphatase RsbU (regulator of sigma subunit)/CheY-like chemotaxis protein
MVAALSKRMTPSDQNPLSDVTILIVEDSKTQSLKLQHLLTRHGYRVMSAPNGQEAMGAISAVRPMLVITDINMPEMDGYELCRRIKDDPALKMVPVILLTSLSDPQDILKGLECGADNFVVKPYDEEFLLSRIQYVFANLELRRQAGGKEATEIYFAGHKYQLTSDRIHSIDLLLSTYETAVHKNLELRKAKEKLEEQAEELREKNAEMHADLEMARELQTAFLPRHYPVFPANASPERSAIQFCHRYSTTTELGGDFFDIVAVSDTEAGVLICDVMGHGVRAALVAAIVRGLVEEMKPIAYDPGHFLTELNHGLCTVLKQTVTPLFVTAFYVVADLGAKELRFTSAGHPPPYHLRRSAGVVEALTSATKPGPALGIFDRAVYPTERRPLSPRDMVMLYTDGLYEVEGPDGEFFTKEQLAEAVSRRITLPAPQLFDDLLAEVHAFSAKPEFEDDMCLVGMEVFER